MFTVPEGVGHIIDEFNSNIASPTKANHLNILSSTEWPAAAQSSLQQLPKNV